MQTCSSGTAALSVGDEDDLSEAAQQEASPIEQQRAAIAAQNPEPVSDASTPASEDKAPAQNATPSEASEGTSGDDGGNPPAAEQPRGKNWAARKIDQLTREREQAIAQNAQLTAVLQKLAGNAPGPVAAPNQSAANDDRGPQREQYQDYERYLEARADWKAQRRADEAMQAFAQRFGQAQQHAQQQTAAQRMSEEFQSRLAQGREKYADWNEVAQSEAAQVRLGEAAVVALTQADDPAGVMYWLLKNPAAAEKFASMPLVRAASEVGRISATLNREPAPSTAPKPGKPVGARGGTPGGLRDDMSMEEFAAARSKDRKGR